MTIVTVSAEDAPALERCRWLARYPVRTTVSGGYLAAKRIVDIIVALVGLLVALPVMVLAAIAIKVESGRGPIVFVQYRAGRRGQSFPLYKLRTMVPDAEALKEELLHVNSRQWPDFKVEQDPRVLRIGRILRSTSIDELPQLFNVLRGDMSLVGPRPTSLAADTFPLWQQERFSIKPGLTGLWQISERNEPSLDGRVRLDIAYATRRSLALDLLILCKTAPAVLRGRGAY